MTAGEFERVLGNSGLRVSMLIVGLVAIAAVLSLGKVILAPITLAVVVGMMFGPLADMLEHRGIRPALSAAVVVLVLLALISVAAMLFIGPLSEWVKRGPILWEKLQAQPRRPEAQPLALGWAPFRSSSDRQWAVMLR